MSRRHRWSIAAVLLFTIITFVDGNNQPTLTIFRCCPEGQALAPEKGGGEVCIQEKNKTVWPVFIYSPSNKNFLKKVPGYWRVKTSKPLCEYIPLSFEPDADTPPPFLLFANGSLWVQDVSYLLDPHRFCVDNNVALVCLDYEDVVQRKKTKIRKCCAASAAYSEVKHSCVHFPNETLVFSNLAANLSVDTTTLVSGFPSCSKGKSGHAKFIVAGGFEEEHATIDPHGVLRLKHPHAIIKLKDYCLEHIFEQTVVKANIFTCPGILPVNDNLTRTPSKNEEWDLRFTIYPIGLVLSVFFLAATIAVGFILPTTHQHMLHWRCQTGHVACLLVGDLLLAIAQFSGRKLTGGISCTIIASAMHFFFLAAFFWLNTMCFNIWWTFRDMRPTSLDKGQETFRLRLYQLYAWGVPLIISGTAAIVDNLPPDMNVGLVRPQFGHLRCWFAGDTEIFAYFYGPLGVLLGVNLVLFCMTARELTCGLWKRDAPKSNVERTALGRVCLKLVVVMGLTWGADILSWAVGGPHYLWYLTDLVNALQGVFIFIVVGCQPQIWAAVNRLWCLKRSQHSDNVNIGQNMSSYSQGLPSMGESVTNSPPTKSLPLETSC